MRWLGKICLLALAPGLILTQTIAQNGPSDQASVAAELKALREAVVQQQQQVAQQQQRIDALQKALEEKTTAGAPRVEDAALRITAPADTAVESDLQEPPKESPLSFRIGGAEFTPGGFVDFENVFRSTNTGAVTSTSFGTIPFSNTVNGHLTEFRTTGQFSRLSLKIDSKIAENKILGYVEGDFNGNDPGNIFVTSNPHTARLRLYWLDLHRGRWEFLGGQSWGLLTPNRTGVSPLPSDLAITLSEDANVHVGINYTRAGTFRAVWHPSDNFAWAFGIENPQQFTGGVVVFPNAFSTQIAGSNPAQFDNGSNGGTPNVAPDFNTKLAWDSDPGGRHFHFEVGGMLNPVKITVLPTVVGATFKSQSKVGGGVQGALNFELIKNFRFLVNGIYGNGVGRYLIGLAPQAVVAPVTVPGGTPCTSVTNPGPPSVIAVSGNCDARLSLVHSGSGLAGFEFQLFPKSQFGVYYGGVYAQRNFFRDLTGGSSQPFIGFGGPNSANTNNRTIQQGTLDWTQTFYRNPQYGALLLVTQYSYLTRSPWFVAAGAPKNAHLSLGFLSLRYVLP
jgi:hypothetical protein